MKRSNMFRILQRRDTDATDQVIERILERSENVAASIAETAAIETVASLYGRAMLAARTNTVTDLSPDTLYAIGVAIVRRGAYVGIVEGSQLVSASLRRVTGGSRRETWRYEVDIANPNGNRKAVYSHDRTVYIVISHLEGKPHVPTPQYQLAKVTSDMLAASGGALADESNTPRGQLLGVPARDGKSSTLNEMKTAITQLRGRLMLLESAQTLANAQGYRSSEYQSIRIGSQIPASLIDLYEKSRTEIFGVYGVPLDLVIDTGGTGRREAWRQFLFGVVSPIGRVIQAELRSKLDARFSLDFDELRASDLTGRARAFQSLVGGGMSIDQAAALSGLLLEDS